MKNTCSILRLFVVLTAMSYCESANASENETTNDGDGPVLAGAIDLYLDAPVFEPIVIGDERFYMVDEDGLRQDTIIYRIYQTLGDHALLLEKEISVMLDDVRDLESVLGDCRSALTEADHDRQFVYQLRKGDQKRHAIAVKRQRLKAILIGTGSGVVALAVGMLIGIFAF